MLVFRSEDHVRRWCEQRGDPMGGLVNLDQLWALGRTWYAEVFSPEWRRRTPREAQEVFRSLGLEGDFWRLT